MKNAILNDLLNAKNSKTPTALITELASGDQSICRMGEITGDLAIPNALNDDIKRALARDKSSSVDCAGLRYFIQVFNPPKRMIIAPV